jgi:hypothetical protein
MSFPRYPAYMPQIKAINEEQERRATKMDRHIPNEQSS